MQVLVPLRSPGVGKTRLAPVLSRPSRATLSAAMLAGVVTAIRDAGHDPTVLAAGEDAARAANRLGCAVVPDASGAGLNGAIMAAERAEEDVLVLLADLPMLRGVDVDVLVRTAGDVVLAPTTDGGSSALLRRPAACLRPAFGRDSAAAHRRAADDASLALVEVDRPGLATDLDTSRDLRSLDRDRLTPQVRRVIGDLVRQ